jgi:putative ABC transport system permease protein
MVGSKLKKLMDGALLREAFIIGYRSLAAHKLRSFLTMLGMIFGVAAVIAMMAIGEGAKQESLQNLAQLGARNVMLDAIEASQLTSDDLELKSPGLCLRDIQALQLLLPDCELSSERRIDDAHVMAGRRRITATVTGVDPIFLQQSPGLQLQGRWFADLDQLYHNRVCVLGGETARELFGKERALGRQVKIAGVWFEVIGLVGQSNATKDPVQGQEIYVPRETILGRIDGDHPESVDRITLTAPTVESIPSVLARVKLVIDRRHHGAKDVQLTVPYDLIRQQQATQSIFNMIMGSIASISLIVGGIGIMNIMLSSVYERTREIGIRRAVGATAFEVLLQFVLEAILLAVAGGAMGVLFGFMLAWGVSVLADWPTQVPIWAVFLSFGVSVGTGLVFGIYPAHQAAAMNPIEALRHE